MKISLLLIPVIFLFSMQCSFAKVAMLPTMEIIEAGAISSDLAKISDFIKKEEVKNLMAKNGVNPEEALKRLASLSTEEIKNLSQQIDKAQAGGDFGVGGILGVMVFIFLVLLITDILGLTKVYPFTK